MNNIPLISIIVPIYNAQIYLSECIDSILTQTFTDFELILIDDGSTDNTEDICKNYVKKDSRIHLFRQKNQGVSSARNLGITKAKGNWIAFVDADDKLKKEYLQELIRHNSSDLIIGKFSILHSTNESTQPSSKEKLLNLHSTKEALEYWEKDPQTTFYYPWGKLFSTKIIKTHEIKFNTDMKVSEDTCFIMQFVCYAKSIYYTSARNYQYRRGTNNQKYAMNYEQYQKHRQAFDDSMNTLAQTYGKEIQNLNKYIHNAFFYCYYISLRTQSSYSKFCNERKLFTNSHYLDYKELGLGILKRNLFLLIFKSPEWVGYLITKIIKIVRHQ